VINLGLTETIRTIDHLRNPEIHHYNNGSHPGISWYIKTVIPHADPEDPVHEISQFWEKLQKLHPRLVRIVGTAYDWDGSKIPGWSTIWLNAKIDLAVSWSEDQGFEYKIVDFDDGLKISATKLLEWLKSSSSPNGSPAEYSRLLEISSFLQTHTFEEKSRKKRSQLRVLE
jgi:hypothetical protein